MKTKFAAVLALMLLPAFAMADWRGGGYGRYGGYHGGYGGYGGYHGGHDYHDYRGGWHGGGRGLFDFSLGFGGYYGGYYPSYGYDSYSTYYPPVVESAPAVSYDYYSAPVYGGAPVYSSAPVVISPAPVITRTYVAPLPPVTYSRPYYYGSYGPSFNVGGRFYFGHR